MANVLIVDDELSIQRMLSYILEREEHISYIANSAGEALMHLHKNPVDLILLDIAMPDVNGIALLQQLRDMAQYENLPIVMLTANTNEQLRKEAEDSGASAFLNKLANPDDLLLVINQLLSDLT